MIDWKPTLNWGTDRGFTGHEQLDDIGLVHMNGRLYDATLARFLQADPALQDPANLQNLNRYAYCYANPLNCTDPSGQTFFLTSAWKHFWHDPDMRLVASIAVGIALGPAGGLLQGIVADLAAQSAIAGFVSGAVASGTFKGAVQGSFTAVVFYGVGSEFGAIKDASGAVDPQLLGQAVAAHAVAGCVTSVVGGQVRAGGAVSSLQQAGHADHGADESGGGYSRLRSHRRDGGRARRWQVRQWGGDGSVWVSLQLPWAQRVLSLHVFEGGRNGWIRSWPTGWRRVRCGHKWGLCSGKPGNNSGSDCSRRRWRGCSWSGSRFAGKTA